MATDVHGSSPLPGGVPSSFASSTSKVGRLLRKSWPGFAERDFELKAASRSLTAKSDTAACARTFVIRGDPWPSVFIRVLSFPPDTPRTAEPQRELVDTVREQRRRPWWRKPLLRLAAALGPPIVGVVLRVLGWTLRLRLLEGGDLVRRWESGERVIMACWHDSLLVMPYFAVELPVCVLVSQHRDGEIAARVLAARGIHVVRGSATRGAVAGFLRLVQAFRAGYNLAVIPDGPRGPRHCAKPGVIRLAKATGAPIFPVSFAASRAVRLGSWDRLMIPLPFARVTAVVGEPVVVARQAAGAQLEEHRRVLEARLGELGRVAEERLVA
jgi:lysophospholipid acyltransferase (LPLAT)-like uncharacterized protein